MGAVNSLVERIRRGYTSSLQFVMLDTGGAGKTTMLYRLKLGETVNTIHTCGFNVETITNKAGIPITIWDTGGGCRIRELWKHYASNTHGIFFFVDSNNGWDGFSEERDCLSSHILEKDEFNEIPLMVVANKQDLPGAASCEDIAEALQLYEIKDRKWHIQATCATSGDGIHEALELLSAWGMEFKQQQQRKLDEESRNDQ